MKEKERNKEEREEEREQEIYDHVMILILHGGRNSHSLP